MIKDEEKIDLFIEFRAFMDESVKDHILSLSTTKWKEQLAKARSRRDEDNEKCVDYIQSEGLSLDGNNVLDTDGNVFYRIHSKKPNYEAMIKAKETFDPVQYSQMFMDEIAEVYKKYNFEEGSKEAKVYKNVGGLIAKINNYIKDKIN